MYLCDDVLCCSACSRCQSRKLWLFRWRSLVRLCGIIWIILSLWKRRREHSGESLESINGRFSLLMHKMRCFGRSTLSSSYLAARLLLFKIFLLFSITSSSSSSTFVFTFGNVSYESYKWSFNSFIDFWSNWLSSEDESAGKINRDVDEIIVKTTVITHSLNFINWSDLNEFVVNWAHTIS
jgi:hypothetical protein